VSLAPLDLPAQSGAFRTTQNGREIVSESYRWTGRTLEATADVPILGHRVLTRATYDDAYQPLSYELRVLGLAGGEEQQVVRVTFGDSVRWTVAGRANGGAKALPGPRAVMQNLVWSHLAAMLHQLPPGGDAALTLHTFLVDNATVLDLALMRRDGRVTASVAGTDIILVLSANGDIESATVPSQSLVVQRVPAESVSASRPLQVRAPAAPPAGVVEEPYAWTSGPQRLAGTLALPGAVSRPMPVVLIIAGSGPTDRDGNSPLGLRSDVYKKLAWALAARGIASVRYDKRGIGASTFMGDRSGVTFDDFTDDAVAGARALAADHRFSRVVLVGHSEGAELATHAANRGAPAAGVVMLAGMGRALGTLLREQVAPQLDSAQLAVFDRTLAAYLASGPMPEVPEELRIIFPPTARRFVQTESLLDPAAEARRVTVPVMVVQGATDIQVSVKDAEAIHAARPDAELHIVPEANHLFVHVATRDRAAQLVTYNDPSLPLVPELVPLVADFVLKVAR
jgi:pimeloyl-ACP methyl ester carboxylesterase